jgi:hypothetical protein
MCSPATVVSSDVQVHPLSTKQPDAIAVRAPLSLRDRLGRWLLGWKQTLIAELASLGSPKEGFR